MKRNLFAILALTAVVAGCSKSDVIDAPNIDTPITFETYSGRIPVTKASVENDNTIGTTGVKVVAYNTTEEATDYTTAFMDETIQKTGEDTYWTYKLDSDENSQPVYYWPSDGSDVEFYAYSAHENVTYTAPTSTDGATVTYTIPDAVLKQKDIVVATPVRQGLTDNATASSVSLNLSHILAKVGFSLNSSLSENELTISSLVINGKFNPTVTATMTAGTSAAINVAASGTHTDSFTFIGSDESYTSKANETGIYANNTDANESNRYMMIAPSGTIQNITIKYTLTGATEKTAEIDLPEDFTFESGKAYEFKLKVSTQKISFDVTVGEWMEYDSGTESMTFPLA